VPAGPPVPGIDGADRAVPAFSCRRLLEAWPDATPAFEPSLVTRVGLWRPRSFEWILGGRRPTDPSPTTVPFSIALESIAVCRLRT
jgi:hypothetical protein